MSKENCAINDYNRRYEHDCVPCNFCSWLHGQQQLITQQVLKTIIVVDAKFVLRLTAKYQL